MQEVKVTRWSTYVVPGSVVVLALGILAGNFAWPDVVKDKAVTGMDPSMGVLLGLVFCVVSYILGIGLWGIAYSDAIQRVLFGNPHKRREGHARNFLAEEWRQKKYYAKLKQYFPDVPETKGRPAGFEYRDFEFVIVSVCEKAEDAMKNRIVADRDTIGILQSLILASYGLGIASGIVAIDRWVKADGGRAIMFGVFTVLIAWVTFTLYVHFFRRNYYLVRDVLMAFLV